MKRIITAILFITGALTALEVGETGLNHLRIQPDARIQGMGGASLGLRDNPQALFANPAGLSSEGMVLGLSYLPYPAGVHIGSILFTPSPNKPLRFSVGALYLNSGQMTITSPTNEELGTFAYHVINLGGTVAYPIIEKLSVGANLKAGLAAADSNTQVSISGDMGVMAAGLLPGLSIGLVVQNAAFEITPFVDERSAMPLGIGGGVSYAGVKNLLLGLDVSKPLDAPLIVRGGVEFLPVSILALRAGYSTQGNAWKTGEGADILAGFSAGIGIHDLKGVFVDYAITPGLDIGLFHRISLAYHF
jgi:hypothetical protein